MKTVAVLTALYLLVLCIDSHGIKEQPITDWFKAGQDELTDSLNLRPRLQKAKNVILFLGDGMGFSNNVASRIYNAQKEGTSFSDGRLAFDKFPYSGLVMTYCVDHMVTDSAASANALLCGEKARFGTIGVSQNVYRGYCDLTKGNELTSVLKYSHEAGKRTGIISTARITHASPAAAYAHSADRDWEANVPDNARGQCKDIAKQLVEDNDYINVILGGGRWNFLPNTTTDPEYPMEQGKRLDGVNLIEEWMRNMRQKFTAQEKYAFVQTLDEFNNVDPKKVERLFGLFEPGHMQYEVDRTNTTKNIWAEPSLADMMEKAIKILEESDEGYFLFVEGGRIDHAHHANNAFRAVNDTVALSQAIQRAIDMTNEKDTLILVTSDHSHVFTVGGSNAINTDIFGLTSKTENGTVVVPYPGTDGLPFTILSYTNGPSFPYHHNNTNPPGHRRNLTEDAATGKTRDIDYLQDSPIPLASETHAGEDVPLYARGPFSHLATGTHEQQYIAHLIMYASCVGPPQGVKTFCKDGPDYKDWPRNPEGPNPAQVRAGSARSPPASIFVCILVLFVALFMGQKQF